MINLLFFSFVLYAWVNGDILGTQWEQDVGTCCRFWLQCAGFCLVVFQTRREMLQVRNVKETNDCQIASNELMFNAHCQKLHH